MLTGKVEYIFEFWRHFMAWDYAIIKACRACISNYSGPHSLEQYTNINVILIYYLTTTTKANFATYE